MGKITTGLVARAAFLAGLCLPPLGWSQIQVNGGMTSTPALTASVPDLLSVTRSFSCAGTPCTGTYQSVYVMRNCPSPIISSGTMSLGFDPTTPPGPIFLGLTFAGGSVQLNFAPACSVTPNGDENFGGAQGAWDGRTGSFNYMQISATEYIFTGGFTVSGLTAPGGGGTSNQVFPITVSSNITATTATANVTLQYRPQDVGTTQSVFVFALAPRSLARALATTKEDGDCVLAQLINGQLTQVTASTMQPALTGVLSAQGASLTVLNNVATPSVAGSQFFVGYGADAGAMLSTGISQNVVSIPGSQQCAASLTKSPGALSGLFGNTSEAGWGINFTQRGNNVFAAWYTYDASGNPKWYVATCAGAGATSGTCSGTLFQVTGPTFFNRPFSSSAVNPTSAGNLQVTFQSADRATVSYTVGTQSRSVTVERTAFPPGTTPPAIDHTDLWWDPNESGWGVALTQKYAVIFAAWYVYSDVGQPVWYVVPNCAVNAAGNRCTGAVYRTTGPAFGPTFNPLAVTPFEVGSATFAFSDANNGSMSYTVNGVSGSKTITRNIF
jgi:hypothetical protein